MTDFNPVAPRLTSVEKEEVRKFERAYNEYQDTVIQYNQNSLRNQRVTIRKRSQCVDRALLEVLMIQELATVNEQGESVPLQGEALENALVKFMTSILQDSSFDEARVKLFETARDLQMNLASEPKTRVISFITSLREKLASLGFARDVGKSPEQYGSIVKTIVAIERCLQPPGLRAWFQSTLDGSANGHMTDKEFMEHLQELSSLFQRTQKLTKLAETYGYTSKRRVQGNRAPLRAKKRQKTSRGHSVECYSCGGPHKVANCPTADVKDKERHARKTQHRARKSSNTSGRSNYSLFPVLSGKSNDTTLDENIDPFLESNDMQMHFPDVDSDPPTEANGKTSMTLKPDDVAALFSNKHNSRYKLNRLYHIDGAGIDDEETVLVSFGHKGLVSEKALLDSGSDKTVISRRLLQRIRRVQKVTTFTLPRAIRLELADGATSMAATEAAELDLKFTLATGTIMLRRVECLVVLEELQFPIIGNKELSSLGIDPVSNLERLLASRSLPKADGVNDSTLEQYHVGFNLSADDELEKVLMLKIQEAKKDGLPKEHWQNLADLITEFRDIFRVSLKNDPPADVTQMDVHLKPDFKFPKAQNRRYSEEELQFLKQHINSLLKGGYIRRNPHSRWASPVMVVPKPKGGYRMVVDLKFPNSQIIPTHWPMPYVDMVMQKLAGSTCYALLDAFKGYWQFPVTTLCGEVYSFSTPYGTFTPTRVIQGAADSVKYFQSGMEDALDIHNHNDVILWVDDLLSHAKGPAELLVALKRIFSCCRDRKIKLSAQKCSFFLKEVVWCGRTISPKGIAFSNQYIQGLTSMSPPETVADLQQFLSALQWMSSSIPNFSTETSQLRKILRKLISQVGSCRKSRLKRQKLSKFPTSGPRSPFYSSLG